jgi:hypothetical protein
MANGKSDYMTDLVSAGTTPSLHTRPRQNNVQTKLRALDLRYQGLGTELNSEYVRLAVPAAVGAEFIPELFKIRHDGTANFSVPVKFVKTTMADGTYDAGSKFDATWTRSSTTCTVTTAKPHGFATNQHLAITNNSSVAAFANGGTGIIVVLTPTTFTFTCLNAGATSGTATFAETASAQRAVTWSRTTTTMTVTTQGAHGLASNDILDVSVWSDLATLTGGALGIATGVITVTGVSTFTFVCPNAGGASGTGTLGPQDGNSVPLTSSVAYTQAAIYTGAGPATVSNGVLGMVPAPVWRKTDELRLVWGVITTVPPTTRSFQIEAVYQSKS